MLSRKWIVFFVIALVFFLLLGRYLHRVPKRHYSDFRVYHHAAQKVLTGEDIYFRDTLAVTPFKYYPFFAFCFIPLGVLPIKAAAGVFFAINFFLVFVLLRLAADITGAQEQLSASPGRELCLLYGLGTFFALRHIFAVWDAGQVTILMCVLTLAGLAALSKGKKAIAGAFLAAAMLIKYTPVIFLPYLIVRRQFKAVAWTIAFAVLWLSLPALAVGIPKELAYLSSWIPSIIDTSLDMKSYTGPGNQSLFSMVIRLVTDCGQGVNVMHLTFEQGKLLGSAFAAVLYLLALIPPFGKPLDQRIDYALLFTFLPLFNPNGWGINFVVLAVPAMLLIAYLIKVKGKDRFVAACVVGGFLAISLLARDIVGKHVQNIGELLSHVTIGALLLVVALLKLKFFGGNVVDQLKLGSR